MEPEAELKEKLEKIGSVFDIEQLLIQKSKNRKSRSYIGPSKVSSASLTEGIKQYLASDDPQLKDVLECEDFVEKYLRENVRSVLEIIAGRHMSSFALAVKHPKIAFYCCDISDYPVQHELQRVRGISNLSTRFKSVEELSTCGITGLDFIFSIESLSFYQEQGQLVESIVNLVNQNGLFLVLDQYLDQSSNVISKEHLWLKSLVGRGVALSDLESYQMFTDRVTTKGLKKVYEADLTDAIYPSAEKTSRHASTFFNVGLFRQLGKMLPDDVAQSVVSSYLRPTALRLGLATYRMTVFQK